MNELIDEIKEKIVPNEKWEQIEKYLIETKEENKRLHSIIKEVREKIIEELNKSHITMEEMERVDLILKSLLD